MLRAMMVASIAFSVSLTYLPDTADACGVKLTVRSPKLRSNKKSANPSKILVVGEKDKTLVKKLRKAGHTVEEANRVDRAPSKDYGLVIADASNMDSAKSEFDDARVIQKRSTSRSTMRSAERKLARRAIDRSRDRDLVARSRDRRLRGVGTEKSAGARARVGAGTETTVQANSRTATARPAGRLTGRGTSRVATAPEPKKVRKAPEPKKAAVTPKKISKTEPAPVEETKPVKTVETPDTKPAKSAVKVKWTREVRFGTNRTNLSAAAKRHLRRNAKWLEANPDASLTIEGHTDTVGDEAYNMDLSERRANAARDFLIGLGVDSSRISVDAKGEEEPAYQPGTSSKNRRVVLIKN
jgi:peptidoglycan-associated lipoprotein